MPSQPGIYSQLHMQVIPGQQPPPPNVHMHPQLHICDDCGAAVGDVYKHDEWHERVAKAAAMKTGKIL